MFDGVKIRLLFVRKNIPAAKHDGDIIISWCLYFAEGGDYLTYINYVTSN